MGTDRGESGSTVDCIAHAHIKQITKNQDSCGVGDVRGILAPDSVNDGKECGARVSTPLLANRAFGLIAGLPGDLVIIGLDPSVEVVTRNLNLVYIIIRSIAFAIAAGTGCAFPYRQT